MIKQRPCNPQSSFRIKQQKTHSAGCKASKAKQAVAKQLKSISFISQRAQVKYEQ